MIWLSEKFRVRSTAGKLMPAAPERKPETGVVRYSRSGDPPGTAPRGARGMTVVRRGSARRTAG